MEISGRLLGLEVDYDAVIRPFSNPDVDKIVHSGRHRAVRNELCGYQSYPAKPGPWLLGLS